MFVVDIHEQTLAWCENNPQLTDLFPIMIGHEKCKKDKPPYCIAIYIIHYTMSNQDADMSQTATEPHLLKKGTVSLYAPTKHWFMFLTPMIRGNTYG